MKPLGKPPGERACGLSKAAPAPIPDGLQSLDSESAATKEERRVVGRSLCRSLGPQLPQTEGPELTNRPAIRGVLGISSGHYYPGGSSMLLTEALRPPDRA